jgi:hydrogenase-4 component B
VTFVPFLSPALCEQIVYSTAVVVGGLSLFASALKENFSDRVGSAAVAVFSMTVLVASVLTWGQTFSYQLPPPFVIGVFPLVLKVDDFTRLFVVLFSIVAFATAIFSPAYFKHLSNKVHKGQYWVAFSLFSLSLIAVVCSADAIGFLVFWEVMALSSAALVASDHVQKRTRKAALIYLGATRIAGGLLAGGFLWMYFLVRTWNFSSWDFSQPQTHWAALLILLGLLIKAGIWPFHLWLPYAYSAAPAPASALMSGFMSKVAMFAIIRILLFGHLNAVHIIWLAFALGSVTAFWGVLFALVQTQLKKLIAYSSIENMGLILMCIAFSLNASVNGHSLIASMALVAALMQCLNHGLFKSLLFLSAGAIEYSAQNLELEHLGGLAKRMPVTWTCMFIGALSLCSMPPLNGFPGKWLLYQSLFYDICVKSSFAEKGTAVLSIGLLAAIGAMAISALVKALAVTFLGNARTPNAANAHECSASMRFSQIFLTISCVVSGLFAQKIVSVIRHALSGATAQTADVHLQLPIFSIAAALTLLCCVLYFAFLRPAGSRQYITWDCGYGQTNAKAQVTADSFAQPSARIFRPILRYQNFSKIDGADRRHFPERINVETRIISLLETKVYAPLLAAITHSSKLIARLQAGSIHLYLLYVCSTLIVLLLLGVAL